MNRPLASPPAPEIVLPAMPDAVAAAHRPSWDPKRFVHRACPVCDADAPVALCRRPDDVRVSRCAGCGMVYLAEIPDDEQLHEFYRAYSEFKGYAPPPKSAWALSLEARRDVHIAILEQFGGLRGKSLLELGASRGGFLERARSRGAEVHAVELDAGARAHLAGRGIDAHESMPADRTHDVICAFHVLEHLAAPAETIAAVARALAPDGRLLLGVPNAGEVDALGPSYVGFRVDLEHLNYFSLASLGRVLLEGGLVIEHFWISQQPSLYRKHELPPAAPLWRRIGNSLLNKIFESRRMALDGSSVLTVLARKTGDG